MIFLTVGGQVPFDRLVRTVECWAESRPDLDIFAQIGDTDYEPRAMKTVAKLTPDEFRERTESSSLVIAHAGMGTILTALGCGVPIIVMPRRASLGEHRNDHQFATVEHLGRQGLLTTVRDEEDLARTLEEVDTIAPRPKISSHASEELLSALREFIESS